MNRILIVEDSPTQAQQLAIVLTDAGYHVEVAPDGAEGYAQAVKGRFELIMVDVYLPDENGFDLCRRIKADPYLGRTPVLINTADSNPKNVLRGLEAGADGFMMKDHSPAEIVARVQRTLAGGARRLRIGDDDYTLVSFQNTEFRLKPTIEQLLNILVSAFEDVINLNQRFKANEARLLELNDEIRRANQALVEANRLKDRFLGMAAHDLQNPLGNINAMASMVLQNECDAEQQVEFLRSIIRASDQMLLLIHDLLSTSTARSGRLEIKPVLQDPVKILRCAFDEFVLGARKKGIELVWNVPLTLPPAELDGSRIAEVLSNLISNGVKYCSRGQSVALTAHAIDTAIEISVRDTGPGIRQEDLPRLFEPFAKLSNKPTAGEPSTGLGLSIVKQIVELHGGRVSAESTPGQGTTFTVNLPLWYRHQAIQ